MDAVEFAKKEFIDSLLKIMVTPNVKQTKHSDIEEKAYSDFIKRVNSNKSATVQLPLDYAIKDAMFELIKDGKVFIESSVKFTTSFTTEIPSLVQPTEFDATYAGNEFQYSFLDNHPGIINVDKLKDIPSDYEGLMAVPPTVLEYKNMVNFNIHRVIYTPKHNGKFIYPRIVVSNKIVVID